MSPLYAEVTEGDEKEVVGILVGGALLTEKAIV